MDNFFKKLYDSKLTRNPQSKLYTLSEPSFNALFDLQQDLPNFAPAKESIINFATASFLYGLFGYATTNFTSVAGGFLATYENGEDIATILICDNNTTYYVEPLIALCDEKIANERLSEIENKFFRAIKSQLQQSPNDLLSVTTWAAENVNKAPELAHLKDSISDAASPFSNDPNSLNNQNCENNHLLLDKFCCETLGFEKDNLSKKQAKQVTQMRENILKNWILPGYQSFIGKKEDASGNFVEGNTQILNDSENLERLYQAYGFENPKMLSAIITMCTTDYSADMVHAIFDVLEKTDQAQATHALIESMSMTPKNNVEVGARRKEFHERANLK